VGFWGQFWVLGAKIFGGNPLGMQRPPIYAFSDIFGPDLTCRIVEFCMGIAISVIVRSLLPVHERGTAYHLTFEHLHHHSTRLRNIWNPISFNCIYIYSASLIVTFACFNCLLINILYVTIRLMNTIHAIYNSVWTFTEFDFVLLSQFGFDWVD